MIMHRLLGGETLWEGGAGPIQVAIMEPAILEEPEEAGVLAGLAAVAGKRQEEEEEKEEKEEEEEEWKEEVVVVEKPKGPKRRNKQVCKHPGCTKHNRLKGFCISHAHEELDEEMVTLYLEKARKSPCRTCSYTDCKKRRRVKAFCSIHAMEVLGKDAVPDERNMPRNYCKYPGCAKWRHLKGFCMQHAHEKLDEEVVEEFQNHQRERLRKNELRKEANDKDDSS